MVIRDSIYEIIPNLSRVKSHADNLSTHVTGIICYEHFYNIPYTLH